MIDTDRLGHAVLEPEGAAFDEVAARWPEVVVEGRIDRRALGRVVFGDPGELKELVEITHPEIRRLVAERIASTRSDVVVVEIPIPVGWLDPSWRRVVVDVDDTVRRSRLLERGMTIGEIEARLAAQPSRDEWRAMADDLVRNDDGLDALARAVDAIWDRVGDPKQPSDQPPA